MRTVGLRTTVSAEKKEGKEVAKATSTAPKKAETKKNTGKKED